VGGGKRKGQLRNKRIVGQGKKGGNPLCEGGGKIGFEKKKEKEKITSTRKNEGGESGVVEGL